MSDANAALPWRLNGNTLRLAAGVTLALILALPAAAQEVVPTNEPSLEVNLDVIDSLKPAEPQVKPQPFKKLEGPEPGPQAKRPAKKKKKPAPAKKQTPPDLSEPFDHHEETAPVMPKPVAPVEELGEQPAAMPEPLPVPAPAPAPGPEKKQPKKSEKAEKVKEEKAPEPLPSPEMLPAPVPQPVEPTPDPVVTPEVKKPTLMERFRKIVGMDKKPVPAPAPIPVVPDSPQDPVAEPEQPEPVSQKEPQPQMPVALPPVAPPMPPVVNDLAPEEPLGNPFDEVSGKEPQEKPVKAQKKKEKTPGKAPEKTSDKQEKAPVLAADGLPEKLPPLNLAPVEAKVLATIDFAAGEEEPDALESQKVHEAAKKMKASGGGRFNLMAYAATNDNDVGDARRIALKRGIAVRKLLVDAGFESERLNVQALGDKTDSPRRDRVDIVPLD